MPAYHLDTSDASPAFQGLDTFARGFVEAMFFSESSCFHSSEFFDAASQDDIAEGRADGVLPSDASAGDLHPDAIRAVAEFCADFQARAASDLESAFARDYDAEQAGRDLYFTHAGHGVGYWDRDALEPEGEEWDSLQVPCDTWTPAMVARRDALKAEAPGERLSALAGRGEVNPWAEAADDAPGGFWIRLENLSPAMARP